MIQTLQWKDHSANNSMHGGSFTIQLQKGSKISKAHTWSTSSTPSVMWKNGWMNRFPKHLQALKDIPTQQWWKKTWSDTKAWVGELWRNFSYLERRRGSWYRALNKHIFKLVASKIFLICAVWWWVWAQLGMNPNLDVSQCLVNIPWLCFMSYLFLYLLSWEGNVCCSWAKLDFWSHSSKEIMSIFSM